MSKLNEDVLYSILKELEYDIKSLHSCLFVNKFWCEIVVPILWKDPWKYLEPGKKKSQFNLIISHLPDEAKENLRIQGVNLPEIRQKPLFNYISFCQYLKLRSLDKIINYNIKTTKVCIVMNEILKLLIKNTKITHLHIPPNFNYQIHLIPGAEYCFSDLKYLQCHTGTNLEGVNKSIKKLKIHVSSNNNNSEILKLIETQKKLNDVCLVHTKEVVDESFCRTLEESLVKHADTIQYLRIVCAKGPITNFLSQLVNLVSLEITLNADWDSLGNACLPVLKFLKTKRVSSKILASLIENTKGHLTEINTCYEGLDNERITQAIYKNCPLIRYLKLYFNQTNILELENLLINCQYLEGLVIVTITGEEFDNLFKILAESSSTNLYKFKFYFLTQPVFKLESLKLFLDSWKCRHPLLLQMRPMYSHTSIKKYFDLIEIYKVKGIVKKSDVGTNFDDFEWIQYFL